MPPKPKFLSLKELLKVVNELLDIDVLSVKVTGGEPLLHPQIDKILKILIDNFNVTLNTNGTILNKLEKLFLYPPYSVQISIDGPKDIHERIRGKGTYEKSLQFIKKLKQSDISKVYIGFTANSINYKYVIQVIEQFYTLVDGIHILMTHPIGRASRNRDLMLSKQSYEIFAQKLIEAKRKYKDFVSFDPFIIYPYILKTNKYNLIKELNLNIVKPNCGAGTRVIHIDVHGNVFPCGFFRISLGNIFNQTLRYILNYNSLIKKLIIFNTKIVPYKCLNCPLRPHCNGGCRALAYYYHRDVLREDPRCIIYG